MQHGSGNFEKWPPAADDSEFCAGLGGCRADVCTGLEEYTPLNRCCVRTEMAVHFTTLDVGTSLRGKIRGIVDRWAECINQGMTKKKDLNIQRVRRIV